MFAFAESLKRQENKLISSNANISLLSSKESALISNNMLQPCILPMLCSVFGVGFSLVCNVYSKVVVCFEPHSLLVVCTRDPLLCLRGCLLFWNHSPVPTPHVLRFASGSSQVPRPLPSISFNWIPSCSSFTWSLSLVDYVKRRKFYPWLTHCIYY